VRGFAEDVDLRFLEHIYSQRSYRHSPGALIDKYQYWRRTAEAWKQKPQPHGTATPEQCKQNVLREIDTEISRLQKLQKDYAIVEASRAKWDALRRSVPDSTGAERLLRYEASLERSFDRTLKQLERLQRTRLGLPVPEPVEVNVSS
jgi:hypothetical protein